MCGEVKYWNEHWRKFFWDYNGQWIKLRQNGRQGGLHPHLFKESPELAGGGCGKRWSQEEVIFPIPQLQDYLLTLCETCWKKGLRWNLSSFYSEFFVKRNWSFFWKPHTYLPELSFLTEVLTSVQQWRRLSSWLLALPTIVFFEALNTPPVSFSFFLKGDSCLHLWFFSFWGLLFFFFPSVPKQYVPKALPVALVNLFLGLS